MPDPILPLQAVVKRHVLSRLSANQENMLATAHELGICIRTLRLWVNKGRWPYNHRLTKTGRKGVRL